MDLYAILFAFVTELTNHETEPAAEQRFTQVVLLDQRGFQTRAASSSATLVQQHSQNGFDEFAIQFCDELVQPPVVARVFDEQAPDAAQMTRNGQCAERCDRRQRCVRQTPPRRTRAWTRQA